MVTPTDSTTAAAQTNGAALPLEYSPEYLSVAYPPNEEPMADPIRLRDYLLALLTPLVKLYGNLPDALVASNVFVYYRLGDALKAVAPDLMVAFGVDHERLGLGKSYHMWVAGKPPDLVMEIGSDSTASRDLNEKRDIYAEMGAREYWLFDPPDGARYGFVLKGLRLVDGEYADIPMTEGSGLDIRGHSDVLGLDLRWENGAIRLYDPSTGEYLRTHDEAVAERDEAVAERDEAVAERDEAVAEVRRLREMLRERG